MSTSLEAIAHHEAAHAVVGFRLGIPLRREGVTIVPDEAAGTGGSSSHRKTIGRDIEYDASDRNRIRAERNVQCLLAGEIAQRRYNSRSVRHYHGYGDRHDAIKLLSYFTGDEKEIGVWLKLLRIRTENMLANPNVWRAVERLAAALMERRTIPGKEATEIIRRGLHEEDLLKDPELWEELLGIGGKSKSIDTCDQSRE